MSQITDMVGPDTRVFLNNFPLKEHLIIKTLFLIFLFNATFFAFYLKMKSLVFKKEVALKPIKIFGNKSLSLLAVIWLVAALVVLLLNYQFIIDELNRPSWKPIDVSVVEGLFKTKILFVLPLSGIIITTKALRSSINPSNKILLYIVLILFFLLLLFFKNPLVTKRHEIGPVFFILLFLFIPKLINSNIKVTAMIFIAMLIGFPLAQLLTHNDFGAQELVLNPSLLLVEIDKGALTNGYISLNYDAFLNIGVVIEYVNNNGLSWGYQMLSGILFFVPRFIWNGKPLSSGLIVGNTLRDHYDFNFTNVSNPFISEAYHNFGIFGVVLFAFALVLVIIIFTKWLRSNDLFKQCTAIYFALHIIMFLRGDFTNGMAYMGGTLISLYLIPKFVELLLNTIVFSKNKIKKT